MARKNWQSLGFILTKPVMRLLRTIFLSCACFLLFLDAQTTPLPLGASDLAPDARIQELKRTSAGLDLRQAFQAETNAQLDWSFEVAPAPTELERLKASNEALKKRVAELERRLAEVEARLPAVSSAGGGR